MPEAPPVYLIAFLVGVLGALVAVAGSRRRTKPPSPLLMVAATLPAVVLLVLYYSLAFHMHQSLGGWPGALGTRNFPAILASHSTLTGQWFSVVVGAIVLVWPVAVALSNVVERWHGARLYLGVFGLSCCACFGAMLLAPGPFQDWWWD